MADPGGGGGGGRPSPCNFGSGDFFVYKRMSYSDCLGDCFHVGCMLMGAGTGGAGWASAHPGKNQGGHGPPWKF